MANTFTQMYIQIVFAVQGRYNLIIPDYKDEIEKYISGIVQKRENKMLSIYCMPDHTHLFIGLNPKWAVSDLVRDIKSVSSGFINDNQMMRGHFNWQDGYGAFSYSRSHIDRVVKYILNQKEHHKKRNFKEEYIELLKRFGIKYDEKYLFNWID